MNPTSFNLYLLNKAGSTFVTISNLEKLAKIICRRANCYFILIMYLREIFLEAAGGLCFGAFLDDGLLDTTSLGETD